MRRVLLHETRVVFAAAFLAVAAVALAPLGTAVFPRPGFHHLFVAALAAAGGLAAIATYALMRRQSTVQSALMFCAFTMLALVFAPHALLDVEKVIPADPLFGPVSRLLFAVLMLAALTPWAARRQIRGSVRVVAVAAVAGALLIDLGLHEMPMSVLTPLEAKVIGVRIDVLAVALDVLICAGLVWQWRRRRAPLQLGMAATVLCLAGGSVLLLLSSFWQLRWWFGHLGLLAASVILVCSIALELSRVGSTDAVFDFSLAPVFGENVIRYMADGLVVLDHDGSVIAYNPAAVRLCGQSLLQPGNPTPLATLGNGRHCLPRGTWVDVQQLSLRHEGKDVSALLIADAGDQVRLEELSARLQHQATTDLLTGLPNRVLAQDRLRQAVALCKRQGTSCAVLFLDLDGFKPINDTYGHQVGDEVLVQLGRRLETSLRASDTCARLGGDEFLVILTTVTDPGDAVTVADNLNAWLSARPITTAGSS